MKPSAHIQLLISAKIKNPPGEMDCEKINDFMRGMVKHIRMTVMMGPWSGWCEVEGNEGISSTVILTTSSSNLHIWNFPEPELSRLEFDLFSCSQFDVDEVFDFINQHFDVESASYKFLDRDTGFTEISQGEYRRNQ